jgi:hypothetical protein
MVDDRFLERDPALDRIISVFLKEGVESFVEEIAVGGEYESFIVNKFFLNP